MDKLSEPNQRKGTYLTATMIRDGMKSLWESYERAEDKHRKYYAALTPLLDKLTPGDLDGMLAVVALVSSGFYSPLHPDDAARFLKIVRDRGIEEFD